MRLEDIVPPQGMVNMDLAQDQVQSRFERDPVVFSCAKLQPVTIKEATNDDD